MLGNAHMAPTSISSLLLLFIQEIFENEFSETLQESVTLSPSLTTIVSFTRATDAGTWNTLTRVTGAWG